MTQPGVGPITALAFVLTIGDVSAFKRGKQVASYLGLIPREHSSGGRQQLGAISKQGNRFAAHVAGGGGADRGALDRDFVSSINTAATTSRKGGESGGGAQVGSTTLLDAAHQTPYPEIVHIESSSRVALVGAS